MSAHAQAGALSRHKTRPHLVALDGTVSGRPAAADVGGVVRRPARLPYADMAERLLFLSVLDPVTECWEWVGRRTAKGYGVVVMRVDGKPRPVKAHRVSFETFTGRLIPVGFELDHRCQNESCINPAHLEPVVGSVNLARRDAARWAATCQREARMWQLEVVEFDFAALDEWSSGVLVNAVLEAA